MRDAVRRRAVIGVLIASGFAHLGVLGLLALVQPELRQMAPPPVFDVEILPRLLPSPARPTDEAAPTRPLQVRPPRNARSAQDVPPLVIPERSIAPPGKAAPAGPATPAPVPSDVRDALRRGPVGCANPDLLSKEERDACLERLGAGAKDAPFIEPPMSRDKRRAFDAAAAKKEAYRRYREGNVPPGVTPQPKPSEAPNPFPDVWTPRQ